MEVGAAAPILIASDLIYAIAAKVSWITQGSYIRSAILVVTFQDERRLPNFYHVPFRNTALLRLGESTEMRERGCGLGGAGYIARSLHV